MTVDPDTVRIELGAHAFAPHVAKALGAMDDAIARMRDAILERGVSERDVRTRHLQVAHRSDHMGNPSGFEASTALTVRLRDVETAGEVVSRVMDAGGDAARLYGLRWEVDDDGAGRVQARDRAFADALSKAEQFARLAGRALGDVISISDRADHPFPVLREESQRLVGQRGLELAPGTQRVAAFVIVVFAVQ